MGTEARTRLLTFGGAVVAAIGGVATNRVEGAWWAQALWFGTAVVAILVAASLQLRAARGAQAQGSEARATRTGKATVGRGGTANTGVTGPATARPDHVSAADTGDAEAGDDGTANTGIRFDGPD
ncbi:hypothetical protein LO762_10740 [Actinocorallia sp. API 0066]|uniref:hypothetical protein n=1 Tax=Actinocorallia sp. API 0066 TaxID=2896846 RepID=UPI001E5A8EAC|nr:hypothetical protein [Actinocorallia sp. API 0066]MCD0449662.1 hypothetical protein [Actinocorallia sp. API 0066]